MNDLKNKKNKKKENPETMMGDVVEDNKKNEINAHGMPMGLMVQPLRMSWLPKRIKK